MFIESSSEEFYRTCEECHSKLRVCAPKLEGHNEPEEYRCPVCHHEYKVRASTTPSVELISSKITRQEQIYVLKEHIEMAESLRELNKLLLENISSSSEEDRLILQAQYDLAEKAAKDIEEQAKKSLKKLSN